MLTQDRLKELLSYDPDTGHFVWRTTTTNRVRVGTLAGSFEKDGYRRVNLDGKGYREHRLAWLYVHGALPSVELDHINRERADNRIANLRLSSRVGNNQNSGLRYDCASRIRGVCWYKQTGKWTARISAEKKHIYLGYFDNLLDAAAARKAAELIYHPYRAA